MTGTMRAYQLLRAGQMPEIVEIPIPEPGPGQIRLRTAGAGLCHSDLVTAQVDPFPFPLPMTMGHEATGWIDKLGEGVEGLNIGDAYGVYFPWGCGQCGPCGHGAENVCDRANTIPGFATGRHGGMAEYIIVDSPRHLVPLGDADPIAAAPLMCAGITTYHAIDQSLPLLRPGSAAVVIGVGGLGHIAIQILKARTSAKVIAVDNQTAKLDHARALGADAAFLGGADTAAAIREATAGLGAALVMDFVGTDATLAMGVQVLAHGGALQIIGVGGGTLPIRFHEMPRDSRVTLPYAGTIPDLQGVVQLHSSSQLHPDVTRITFDQLEETYRLMDSGQLKGRAVLVP